MSDLTLSPGSSRGRAQPRISAFRPCRGTSIPASAAMSPDGGRRVCSRFVSPHRRDGSVTEPMRDVDIPEGREDSAADAAEHDHWSGSRHVVQVRPHVWNWLAPRIGGGEVLEIGRASCRERV